MTAGPNMGVPRNWPGFDGAYLKDIPASCYAGERRPDGRVLVEKIDEYGDLWSLDPRFDLRSHSPDGFNFGYGGSGPAQLALAILSDALGPVRAQELYRAFKRDVIARL